MLTLAPRATRVTQHNAQYAKLLPRRGYSTVYYAQNNSGTYEIMLANDMLTLFCLCLHLWLHSKTPHVVTELWLDSDDMVDYPVTY